MNPRDKHVPEPPQAPVSDAVEAEVRRRREAYARDGQRGRPWNEILEAQRRRLLGRR